MIKNIIFDLGNVVLKLKWEIVINRFAKNDEEKSLFKKFIFDSKEWEELDAGTISEENAIKSMQQNLPEHLHSTCKEIMNTWTDGLVINYEMLNFIEKLKELGYKTYVLSNAPLTITPFLKKNDLNKYFDGEVISAEIKLVKPQKEIYEYILKEFSLDASESFFIDDRKENIDAAKSLNINGHVFDYNNFNALLEELEKYNVKIN